MIFVTVDPGNPALHSNADRSLERMFAHELHHAARWDGPGYGSSLCEALVSEGLAGHFVLELFGGAPEPWEQLPEGEIRFHATHAGQDWDRANYNHDAWFFGRGNLPRWLGYSLGFRLVERFLSEHPRGRASKPNRDTGAGIPVHAQLALILACLWHHDGAGVGTMIVGARSLPDAITSHSSIK